MSSRDHACQVSSGRLANGVLSACDAPAWLRASSSADAVLVTMQQLAQHRDAAQMIPPWSARFEASPGSGALAGGASDRAAGDPVAGDQVAHQVGATRLRRSSSGAQEVLRHRRIQTNGIRMHVAEAGSGPLSVCCTGPRELFVGGRRDPAVLFGRLEPMAAAMPNLRRTVLLPNCGHWTQQERPEDVNDRLLDFFWQEQ